MAVHTASANAAERVLLSNGFEIECSHSEPIPENKLRLYLISPNPSQDNYIDVITTSISNIETFTPTPLATPVPTALKPDPRKANATLTPLEMKELIADAGQRHHWLAGAARRRVGRSVGLRWLDGGRLGLGRTTLAWAHDVSYLVGVRAKIAGAGQEGNRRNAISPTGSTHRWEPMRVTNDRVAASRARLGNGHEAPG